MDIRIGAIGPGYTDAAQVIDAIAGTQDDTIHLRISSPGGSVYDAMGIIGALDDFAGRTVASVLGLAASAASAVAAAADEVRVSQGARMMMHSPWAMAFTGNASEMRLEAERLDEVEADLIGIYNRRLNQSPDDIRALMQAETWYSDTEAVAAGLADTIIPRRSSPLNADYSTILAMYRHVPADLEIEQEVDTERLATIAEKMQKITRSLRQ
jgi:ATP-dependent protease ClpP protease subunit